MSDSHFYLTQCKRPESIRTHILSAKKLTVKTFQQWPKVVKSITQYLLPEEYYQDKPFKPGMDVFKALLSSQGPSMKQYNFNIPLTLMGEPYTYNIVYSQHGVVDRKIEANQQQIDAIMRIKSSRFYQAMESESAHNVYEEFCQKPDAPLFTSKVSNERIGCISTIINREEYTHKIKTLPKREHEVYQKYIVPYQFKANIVRLHLYTRRSKKQTLTNAYKIINKLPMYNPVDKTVSPNLFNLDFGKQNSFSCVQLKGKPLKSYIQMTQSLVCYLEDYLGVCITAVVADYTMDRDLTPWFIALKAIKYTMKMTKDVKLTVEELEQLSLSSVCKLCGMFFTKEQVCKKVTFKLIYSFLNHLKMRGVQPDLNLPKSRSSLHCKVCTFCYGMMMQQMELFKLSTELSLLQNIADTGEEITTLTPTDLNPSQQMYRWRFMVYFSNMADSSQLLPYDNLELQFKVLGTRTRIALKEESKQQQQFNTKRSEVSFRVQNSRSKYMSRSIGKESTTIDLMSKYYQDPSITDVKQIKTFYFLSSGEDLTSLFKNQEMVFRITNGKDWNNWVCQGNSRALGYLTNLKEEGQIYGTEVYMFFQNLKYFRLGVSLGLKCDGLVQTPQVQTYDYKNIKVIKGKYYVCQPLPIGWVQLFSDQ